MIDWEIWSGGDPRFDLAWFLTTTVANGNPLASRSIPDYPDAESLLESYLEQSSDPLVDRLTWFLAFVKFKGAATMSLNVKHNRRRVNPDPEIERRAALCVHLLEQAWTLLETDSPLT